MISRKLSISGYYNSLKFLVKNTNFYYILCKISKIKGKFALFKLLK